MDGPVQHITRVFNAVTSQIFRCQGLSPVPPDADKVGLHDLAYWLLFLFAGAAWFLILFVPERQRLTMLESRQEALHGHLRAEKRELARLQRSLKALEKNDPMAWERAARGRLGWLEPGETTDLSAVARASIQLSNERRAAEEARRRAAPPPPNLQRPQIPIIPRVPPIPGLQPAGPTPPAYALRPATPPATPIPTEIGAPPPLPVVPSNIRAAGRGTASPQRATQQRAAR